MIDPRGMSVYQWTDAMSFQLADTGVTIMKLLRESDWVIWARNLLNNVEFSGLSIPDPDQFSDWREWAVRFNAATDLLG